MTFKRKYGAQEVSSFGLNSETCKDHTLGGDVWETTPSPIKVRRIFRSPLGKIPMNSSIYSYRISPRSCDRQEHVKTKGLTLIGRSCKIIRETTTRLRHGRLMFDILCFPYGRYPGTGGGERWDEDGTISTVVSEAFLIVNSIFSATVRTRKPPGRIDRCSRFLAHLLLHNTVQHPYPHC